jgi:hypothetical protein
MGGPRTIRDTQVAGVTMATPGQLINTMAEILGVPVPTVAQYDRQLAEAELRTVSGRGRSAAKVNAVDAANLLITIMGSPISGPTIAAAQETCMQMGDLPAHSKFRERVDLSVLVDFSSQAYLNSTHSRRDCQSHRRGEPRRAISHPGSQLLGWLEAPRLKTKAEEVLYDGPSNKLSVRCAPPHIRYGIAVL